MNTARNMALEVGLFGGIVTRSPLGDREMDIFFILVGITIATGFVEVIISGRWLAFYFRIGIPLFRKTFRFSERPAISPDALCSEFTGGMASPLIFRSLGPNDIGFREKFFCFRLFNYTPVMHGLIRVDEVDREVSITGYVNWFVLAFSATFISMDISFSYGHTSHLPMSLFLLAILGIIYIIQFARFSKVFRRLEEQYSERF